MAKETVLVVDDEEHIIELTRMYLEQEGFAVEEARDGAEALEKIRARRPALIPLGRIFERFYRGDKSRTKGGRGAGLGLAIVKEIIQPHGGGTEAESVVGLGTKFTISLPQWGDGD